jgi:hypothetical protein
MSRQGFVLKPTPTPASAGPGHGAMRRPLRRKLTVGSSLDPLEVEADRVADQVLNAPVAASAGPHIQRPSSDQADAKDGDVPPSVDHVLASAGSPLALSIREDMEPRFGCDFSRVRVHSDPAAARSASDVSADAYTVGHHVAFGAGRLAPETTDGRRLIAHELTHVVQQQGANASSGADASRGHRAAAVLRRQPATESVLTRGAPRQIASCAAKGRKGACSIDQLSKAVFTELSASKNSYVTVYGRANRQTGEGPGEASVRAETMRLALIQWIGPSKFSEDRYEASITSGADDGPELEIWVGYRPTVLSNPKGGLPTPPAPPLRFIPPERKEGKPGMPPPPAGPSRDDPKSAEDTQKDLSATITTGPEKTEAQRTAELDKQTSDAIEKGLTTLLDAAAQTPEIKDAMTKKVDPIVDNLPLTVMVTPLPVLSAAFIGLYQTRGEWPVAKWPPVKLSSGKIFFGMDTRVQITFRGPVNRPTELAASITLLKSAHPSVLPEGAEINLSMTAKFPDSSKPIAPDNLKAIGPGVITFTIPLPGDPKAKK